MARWGVIVERPLTVLDAISYKRFSSRKQGRGDSERRQTELAQQYCDEHGLKLIDTYLDAGLSGFTGQNLSDRGALRALLDAAKTGRFKPGTHLIVESLDRLSRQECKFAINSDPLRVGNRVQSRPH